MALRTSPGRAAGAALWAFAAAGPGGAQLVPDPGEVPDEGSYSENVDFGDLDLDGDRDVVVADGGDAGNDLNRLRVNRGGLQGGTVGYCNRGWVNDGGAQRGAPGFFTDDTAAR